MASEDNLLSRIAALVAGFDDASWEALSSKGLLRRARKDMEKGVEVELGEEVGDSILIKVQAFLVSMPVAGPARATCTCPAPGVCQHILVAGLYLQSRQLAPAAKSKEISRETIREEVAYFTPERLKAWAGAADYRAGVALFEKNTLPTVVEYGETVLIRLMPSNIEARYVARGGLDGMVVPSVHGKRVAVASLLALRRSLGYELPESGVQKSLIEICGAPRTQKEILESAAAALEDAIQIGLTHVSPMLAERLVTLAVSCQGADLPRVSLSLKTIADEMDSILKREARADESHLLFLMARAFALTEAIRLGEEAPSKELAGAHRSVYVDVREIELFGVGAYTWKTGSGYQGLTVLFWSNQSKEIFSWSEARPATQRFDPRQRFYGEGPWEGAQSPQQVACSQIKLRNARRTANGRLSGSTKTSALVLAPTPVGTLDFGSRRFTSWNSLERYVRGMQPLGLREPNPLGLIVMLEPTAFGTRKYDSVSQSFEWEVYDRADQIVKLSLPFREWSRDAIRVLEELTPRAETVWRVVARASQRDGVLFLEPISILRPEVVDCPVFQLAFDTVPVTSGALGRVDRGIAENDSDDPSGEDYFGEEEAMAPTHSYSGQLIAELNRHLLRTAEMGCQNAESSSQDWFRRSVSDFYNSGFTLLASATSDLVLAHGLFPGDLLRLRYLAYLHTQTLGQAV